MSGALSFVTHEGTVTLRPRRAVIAGWTGRDANAVAHHIEELAGIGVPRPSRTPLCYEVAPSLLTQEAAIHCVGDATSGEAEPVVLFADGRRWLTVGSDHTDRRLEAYSVALSKQICAKPLAREAWPLEAVLVRADRLLLKAEVSADGLGWSTYQEGTLAALLPIDDIVAASGLGGVGGDAALYCGTLSAIGGVRPTPHLRVSLTDPETGNALCHVYRTHALAEAS